MFISNISILEKIPFKPCTVMHLLASSPVNWYDNKMSSNWLLLMLYVGKRVSLVWVGFCHQTWQLMKLVEILDPLWPVFQIHWVNEKGSGGVILKVAIFKVSNLLLLRLHFWWLTCIETPAYIYACVYIYNTTYILNSYYYYKCQQQTLIIN